MNISFSMTSEEANLIGAAYGFDDKSGTIDAFVLEVFKKFGRNCIISQAIQSAESAAEVTKKTSVDAAKASISF